MSFLSISGMLIWVLAGTRVGKAKIAFARHRLPEEIAVMQRVDQGGGMFKLAIGTGHGGLAKRLDGITTPCHFQHLISQALAKNGAKGLDLG